MPNSQLFNWFTRFNIQIGQYLLYIYLMILTLVVIVQINRLQEANAALKSVIASHQRDASEDLRQLREHDELQLQAFRTLESDLNGLRREQSYMNRHIDFLTKRGFCDEN